MAERSGPSPGLCATCRYSRRIVSGKGSTFLLCERSRTDASFPRYPGLPVLHCRGYVRVPETVPDHATDPVIRSREET